MVVLNISIKARMGERKFWFKHVFESRVESILGWSKASNSFHIEKSVGYHAATKLKCISRTLPKVMGWDGHVNVVIGTSS